MKVIFLMPRFRGGGAEFVAQQWMEYLQSKGDDVLAATTNMRADDVRPESIRVEDISGSASTSVRRLRRLLLAERPDVVVALMPYWNLLALVSTRGLRNRPRVVISGRNMATQLRSNFGIAYRLKQALARVLYRMTDEFIAISHPVAAEAIALYGIAPSRVSVVLNPSLKGDAEQQERRVSPEAPLAIVAAARLVSQKRPELVIETAAVCRETHGIEAEAHFFGVGPLAEDVAALAAKRSVKAHMHGWVADWAEQTPPNSVLLLPSVSEGFGNVLVEAARMSIPSVVTSQAMGVADAVVPGITGVYVAGNSPSEFANGVIEASQLQPTPYGSWLQTFTKEESGRALRERLLHLVNPQ